MNLNTFTPKKLLEAVDKCLDQTSANPIAAFDADGTLWANDMGEGLFRYQIEKRMLPNMPEDPWAHYLKMQEKISPQAAYLWLAQINAGFGIDEVRSWAKQSVSRMHPVPVFGAQRQLIAHLRKRGVEVYIVTASVKWAVEPAAELFDLSPDNVIGIATKIENGKVSCTQSGPITYREGKVDGLLEATGQRRAFFCAGNTTGDLSLIESATHLQLVVASAQEGQINYQKEREMIERAHQHNWFYQDYLLDAANV